jgi:hypothetical protein
MKSHDEQDQINSLEQSISSLQQSNTDLNDKLNTITNEFDSIRSQDIILKQQLKDAQAEIKLYQNTGISVQKDITPNIGVDLSMTPLSLIRNINAHNPTWDELMSFIKKDKTDFKPYGSLNLCGWFAEQVFNNAESNGIKAAFVAVDFEEGIGHALNAFVTTDRGLVYIDCTGTLPTIPSPQLVGVTYISIGDIVGNDKIAYLEKGEPMGDISVGTPYGLSYSDYEQWQKDVQKMKTEFNSANTIDELNLLKNQSDTNLGTFWRSDSTPDNIVKSIEIYW